MSRFGLLIPGTGSVKHLEREHSAGEEELDELEVDVWMAPASSPT